MEDRQNTQHGAGDIPDGAFAMAVAKGGEESFPVLKAFQDFLEAEREKARRRQMVLVVSFVSAIVVIVIFFCMVGVVLFGNMMQRSDSNHDKLLELLLINRAAPTAPAVVETPPAVAPTAVAASSTPVETDPQLAELMEEMKRLRAENEEMRAAHIASNEPVTEDLSEALPAAEHTPDVTSRGNAHDNGTTVIDKNRGMISVVKRGTVNKPAPAVVKPDPVKATKPAAKPVVIEQPAEKSVEVQPSTPTPVAPKKSSAPMHVKVTPVRTMYPPKGTTPAEISVVTEDNVRYPWRILMPTGAAE